MSVTKYGSQQTANKMAMMTSSLTILVVFFDKAL